MTDPQVYRSWLDVREVGQSALARPSCDWTQGAAARHWPLVRPLQRSLVPAEGLAVEGGGQRLEMGRRAAVRRPYLVQPWIHRRPLPAT